MEFQFSKRAESFQPNIFNILNEKRQALIESGKKIYNMSVGTPDFPPAQHVLDVVSEAAKNPEEYKYSLGDTGELLSAVEAGIRIATVLPCRMMRFYHWQARRRALPMSH